MEKFSELIEIVRAGEVNILIDLQLSPFRNCRNAKDDDSDAWIKTGSSAYSMRGREKLLGPKT